MDVPLDDGSWTWGGAERTIGEHQGRPCVCFDAGTFALVTVAGVELLDGTIEADISVGAERAFHGVVWRVADAGAFRRPRRRLVRGLSVAAGRCCCAFVTVP